MMDLGSLDWYLATAKALDDLYKEELLRPSEPTGNANWLFHMREYGRSLDWVRSMVQRSPEWQAIHAVPMPAPLPDIKSRAAICGVRMSFQGLTVMTAQFGSLPWFDSALFSLTPADRQAIYAAKRAAGDTHALIQYDDKPGSIYDEPGQPYQQMMGPAFVLHPQEFLAAVEEVLRAGFVPMVFMGGDDGELGYVIADAQLQGLIALLQSGARDFTQDVLISPGYDGVFYGWTPEHIVAFGQKFRRLCPQGHLAIEHQPGRIPVGNGPSDWMLNANRMDNYDVLLSEFNNPPETGDQIWQIAARTLGPAYVRPHDQPAGDDPQPPFYLASGTARGPYYVVAFEFAEYPWVRGRISAADVVARRIYLRLLGYSYTG